MDSIEILNSVEIGGILTAAFEMSDGNLAVGSKTGVVSILSSNGIIEESFNLEGEIIGLFEIEIPNFFDLLNFLALCNLFTTIGSKFTASGLSIKASRS